MKLALGSDKTNPDLIEWNNLIFWVTQLVLFFFLVALVGMGVQRALWQAGIMNTSFSEMIQSSDHWVLLFIVFGI